MSNTDRQTSAVPRTGTVLGIGIMAIGLLLTSFDISEDILTAGIGILIFTPVAGVAVSTKCLWQEGDRKWTGVALILIAAITVGMILSFVGL